MSEIKTVCVFCGSSGRVDEIYREGAREMGRRIAESGRTLVYGGGRVGLMGLVADGAKAAGGRVVGIIPRFLQAYEVGHEGLDELIVTESMHERKQLMYERADAFVTLPGGLGTLDETFEVMTWTQLGLSNKPVLLLDLAGFWQPFLAMVDHCVATGFARPANRDILTVVDSVDAVMTTLAHEPVIADHNVDSKWL